MSLVKLLPRHRSFTTTVNVDLENSGCAFVRILILKLVHLGLAQWFPHLLCSLFTAFDRFVLGYWNCRLSRSGQQGSPTIIDKMTTGLVVRQARFVFGLLVLLLAATHATALFCGDDNCFELLGIKRTATKAEVRRAYRQLSSVMHPDKRPGVEGAVEEFAKIGAAYETLTDKEKRAKYEDFLDNPGKYWQYLMDNAKDVYAPKSNVFLVITGIVGIATLIHWLNMNNTYKQTLRGLRETQEFKREVTRLVKSKQAKTKEEAEVMINLDVVGLDEPDWRNLIIFKLISLPGHLAKLASWKLNWIVAYKIRKQEYSEDDKIYLIQKNMKITEEAWEKLSEKDKQQYITEELWDSEKCEDFLFKKRIELNRLGKNKKKKKHTAIPYSEVEDVTMSE